MATSAPSIFPALAQLDIGDVLAHMPGGFFVYHADGDEAVVYVNEACLRIFGCADEEQFVALTGGAFPGMVHPEDIEAVEHSISRQIQADRYSMDYVEYRIIRRDGSVRWIEDYGTTSRWTRASSSTCSSTTPRTSCASGPTSWRR